MRDSIRVDAVARDPSPADKRMERWWSWGMVDGAWEVARKTARWRVDLESMVALESDALSFITPIISRNFVIFPI